MAERYALAASPAQVQQELATLMLPQATVRTDTPRASTKPHTLTSLIEDPTEVAAAPSRVRAHSKKVVALHDDARPARVRKRGKTR